MNPIVQNDQFPTFAGSFEAEAIETQDDDGHSKGDQRGCQQHISWPSLGISGPDVAAKGFIVSSSDESGNNEGHECKHDCVENRGQSPREHPQLLNPTLPFLGDLFEISFLLLELLIFVRNRLVLRVV